MYKINRQLPTILECYRDRIEATIKPYLSLDPIPNENLTWWQSKFPGRKKSRSELPYLPKEVDYPKTSDGEYLYLLAQINFAEAPTLEGFPESGILQFYIANDDSYGLFLPTSSPETSWADSQKERLEQNRFRILYFKEADFNEERLTTDFSFLPEKDDSFLEPYPEKCSAIAWSKGYAPISIYDYNAYDRLFPELGSDGVTGSEMEDLCDKFTTAYEWTFSDYYCNIQMGGYRFHLSGDPRYDFDLEEEPFDTLLLSIGLVENGSLFFYIQSSALARCDFSKVLYALA